jgi:hypothetical protein
MRTVFAVSNFYTSLATMYEDLGTFGTAAMIIYEDFDDVIRCYNTCAGEYFLANSAHGGGHALPPVRADHEAAGAAKFGSRTASQSVQAAWQRGRLALARIIVATRSSPTSTWPRGPWACAACRTARCTGSTAAARTRSSLAAASTSAPSSRRAGSIVGNDAYGRGPGMDALGDVKQLQVEQKRKAQAIDKLVNPPMVADVQLKNEPATLLPGGVTYVTNTQGVGFKPAYEVKPDLDKLLLDIQECQSRVERTFFNDLFLMISQMDGVQPQERSGDHGARRRRS